MCMWTPLGQENVSLFETKYAIGKIGLPHLLLDAHAANKFELCTFHGRIPRGSG